MKKVLLSFLTMSYLCTFCMVLSFCLNEFAFKNIISYFIFAFSLATAIYLQYLYIKVKKEDEEFNSKLFYAKKLLDLRQKAILDFYLKNGIIPQYDEDGKLKDIDKLLGILTKLDEHGLLTPSVYEILGIKPTMTLDGKEVPTIFVLKHLMKPLKKKDFDKIAKYHKLVKKNENVKDESAVTEAGKNSKVAQKTAGKSGSSKSKGSKEIYIKTGNISRANGLAMEESKGKKGAAKGDNKKGEQKDNNKNDAKKDSNVVTNNGAGLQPQDEKKNPNNEIKNNVNNKTNETKIEKTVEYKPAGPQNVKDEAQDGEAREIVVYEC